MPLDNDEGEEYNAFPIFKARSDVRLADIWEHFPLPGTYHFRFQHVYNKTTLVWLDLNNEGCVLPEVEGKIVVKAHWISWNEEAKSSAEPGIRKANSDVHQSNPVADLKVERNASMGPAGSVEDIFGSDANDLFNPAA